MQQKSENYSEYSERTEYLARTLGINLSELPRIMDVSASMFHAYRGGKYPISAKSWRKLESAETAAGIVFSAPEESGSSILREDPTPYRATQKPEPLRTAGEPTMLERLETLQRLYGETRQELAQANRKLDALIDIIRGDDPNPKPP